MEALQMLKYSRKKECLNFMDGWPTSEAVMSGVLLHPVAYSAIAFSELYA
jgi:hypothetical protein